MSMKTLEQWVLEKYPIWTIDQADAIKGIYTLRQQWVHNSFRSNGKTTLYYDYIQSTILQVLDHLPQGWLTLRGFAKIDPITLDQEYFARYPTLDVERQRRRDLVKMWKRPVSEDVIGNDVQWTMAIIDEQRWHYDELVDPIYSRVRLFNQMLESMVQKKNKPTPELPSSFQKRVWSLNLFMDDMLHKRRTAKTIILDGLTPITEGKQC